MRCADRGLTDGMRLTATQRAAELVSSTLLQPERKQVTPLPSSISPSSQPTLELGETLVPKGQVPGVSKVEGGCHSYWPAPTLALLAAGASGHSLYSLWFPGFYLGCHPAEHLCPLLTS